MGTFLGVVVGLFVLAALARGRARWFPSARRGAALAPLIGIWAVDGLNSFAQWITGRAPLYEPSNALRLFSGLGMGLAIAVVLYPILHYAASPAWRRDRSPPLRLLARGVDLVALLGIGALTGVTIVVWRGAPYWAMATLAVGAATVALSLVNAALVALIAHLAVDAVLWVRALLHLAAGLGLALAETGLMAVLRGVLTG